MGNATRRLRKGKFAYSAHALSIRGDILDVFMGEWVSREGSDAKSLIKHPEDAKIEVGVLMCVIELRRPMTVEDYRQVHHQEVKPLVRREDELIRLVLMPASMACTIPDGM